MRVPFSLRLLPIGALAVAGMLTGGVSIAVAQLVNSPPGVQPSRGEVVDAAVREASLRFGVPEQWIRAVMRVESANDPRAVPHARSRADAGHRRHRSLPRCLQQLVQRSLDIKPTLTVRPGYPVRVILTRDLVLEP